MNEKLKSELLACETDLDGALSRFANDEELYISCLLGFLDDTTISDLQNAVAQQQWDDAFTAAHAFKGMVGNMGFVPLYHATAHFIVLFRSGRITELSFSFQEIISNYNQLTKVIKHNCSSEV